MHGVRKPEEARELGLSRRLTVRLGALLKQKIEITAAVLEAAKSGSATEAALLDPELLEQAAALDATLLSAIAARHLGEAARRDPWAVATGTGGQKVICLQEELEAGEWDAAGEDETTDAAAGSEGKPEAQASSALATRKPTVEGGGEPLFSRPEIDRLRLKLVTASGEGERLEALRVLAHAPLGAKEKAEAVFLGLEDRHAEVRREAAGLLFVLGVSDEILEALQGLSAAREEDRLRSAERLLRRIEAGAREVEGGAAAACALAALKAEGARAVQARLLNLLGACAGTLARTPPRAAELVRIVLRLVAEVSAAGTSLHQAAGTTTPAQRLCKRLGQAAPEAMLPVLRGELDQCADPAVEAFLLLLLLDFHPPADARETELLELCAGYLARDTKEGRDSRAIGIQLAARGAPAIHALARQFGQASAGSQKYMLQLFDDIVRKGGVPREDQERAAACVLHAMESGSRSLRMVAMHRRFVTGVELAPETREQLARRFIASLHDFGFPADREIAEEGIARMGLPAVAPLLERLSPESRAESRLEAVRILGQLGQAMKVGPGEMPKATAAVETVLRKLMALSAERTWPYRGALYAALGKVAASPAGVRDGDETVSRTLLKAIADGEGPDAIGALEGLTYLAASRRADAPLIATVTGLIRRTLDEVRSDIESVTREVDGETVIEIVKGEDLVEKLPVALSGISRIARAPGCPPAFVKDLVKDLLARWRRILAGEVVWGPANVTLAVRALQEIGTHAVSDDLRLEMLKALAPRLSQLPVMQAMSRIAAARDSEATQLAALTLGLGIANRRQPDGRYEHEDRPEILQALARIAARKHLGASDAAGRQKAQRFRAQAVEDLFQGATDLVPGAYEGLIQLRDAQVLPKEEQETMERRLAELHSIQVAS